MFLGLLMTVVLVMLGMLNAQGFVRSKHDKLSEFVTKIEPYETYLGLAGVIFGIIGFLDGLSMVPYLGIAPLTILTGIVSSLLLLGLGFLSFAPLLKGQLIAGNDNLVAKVDQGLAKLSPYKNMMGIIGIFVGILYFLFVLARA